MKPKVLLDISLLGHARPVWRGMERVARQFFHGLRNEKACELTFAATSHLVGAYDFLVAEGISPEEKLKFRAGQLRSSRMGFKLGSRVHRSIENRSLPARAYRWLLAETARACIAGESVLTSDMLDADIFHSLHQPFPPAVRQANHLRKFMTVYDFNPLKYPEFFGGSDSQYMDNLIACLTPDNFAFCISETVRDDILKFSTIPPERIFLTPLAADENIFYPETNAPILAAIRSQYHIPEENYFLSLSAHAPHKNFPHLIHCFSTLVETGELNDTNLVLVGPNPNRNPEVRETLAKYPKAAARVIIAGRVPDEHLAAIYSGASAFLFPSLFEGFGIPPLEAMQCGIPVIASNTTSMPEVIGDAGILLPPTDADGWRQAMLRLARQPALRAAFSEKSRQRAKLFSWHRFIQQTLDGYRASLQMPRS